MFLLISYWLAFGFGLGLIASLHLLTTPDRRWLGVCVLALTILVAESLGAALHLQSPLLWASHELALYAVAPALFLAAEAMIGNPVGGRVPLRHLWPLLPISGLILAQLRFPLLDNPLQKVIYAVSFAAGSVYIYKLLGHLRRFAHPHLLRRAEAVMLGLIASTGLVAAVVALLGSLLANPLFQILHGSAITALLTLGLLLHLRFPAFAQLVADAVQDAEPRRSQLSGLDVEATLRRLDDALGSQAAWQDDTLSLASLATKVGVRSHQLSALINEHKGMNFSRLIKQHRVAAARELLVAKPGLSVLDVAMAVGFSSLSAFYAAFREIEGASPGAWRRTQLTERRSDTQ